MSFILDALRKSEIERQRQSGPSMAEFPVARQDRRLPVALIAIGFLLAVNLAVVLFFMLRSENKEPEHAAAAVQVAAAPASVSNAAPAGVPPANQPAPALTGPPQPAPTAPGAYEVPGAYVASPEEAYGAPATLPPDAPDPTLIPEGEAPAGPAVTFTPPSGTEDAASVMSQTGLPPLTIDLHIYADEPAKRAVFINGRRYTQGAQIVEGPKVEQITRDGALLTYRGRRFLLPRL
jgi:general secretion pathway protein B